METTTLPPTSPTLCPKCGNGPTYHNCADKFHIGTSPAPAAEPVETPAILSPEREAWLRAKPVHYHVHELWPTVDGLRAANSALTEQLYQASINAGLGGKVLEMQKAEIEALTAKLAEAERERDEAQQWVDSEPEWKAQYMILAQAKDADLASLKSALEVQTDATRAAGAVAGRLERERDQARAEAERANAKLAEYRSRNDSLSQELGNACMKHMAEAVVICQGSCCHAQLHGSDYTEESSIAAWNTRAADAQDGADKEGR